MNILVPVALFGWVPVVLSLFTFLPPRRAVITAFLLAWLFLPIYAYEIPGLPDYTKTSATCVGVLLGLLLFDLQRLVTLKFQMRDLPILLFCFSPIPSSLVNGLGLYDGLSSSLSYIITWGLPYLIGRSYFNTLTGLRELTIGIFIGGVIYVPLCMFEIRMSPQLHHMVYGFHQHSFIQSMRFGGFRPTVFLEHGLAVGMWMTTTALIGLWLMITGTLKTFLNFPIGWFVSALVVTTILCKSTYSVILLIIGLSVLCSLKWFRFSPIVLGVLLIPSLYIGFRTANLWAGSELVYFAATYINPTRASSLQFRLDNEDILKEKALQKRLFGWGGWGRSRVYDNDGRDISVTDASWIIIFGKNGFWGLILFVFMLSLPTCVLWWNYSPKLWAHPSIAPAASLAIILNLYLLDNLMNAMKNPIYMLAVGGLTALVKEGLQTDGQVAVNSVNSNPWQYRDTAVFPANRC